MSYYRFLLNIFASRLFTVSRVDFTKLCAHIILRKDAIQFHQQLRPNRECSLHLQIVIFPHVTLAFWRSPNLTHFTQSGLSGGGELGKQLCSKCPLRNKLLIQALRYNFPFVIPYQNDYKTLQNLSSEFNKKCFNFYQFL